MTPDASVAETANGSWRRPEKSSLTSAQAIKLTTSLRSRDLLKAAELSSGSRKSANMTILSHRNPRRCAGQFQTIFRTP